MTGAESFAAVVVTRGDVDLAPIVASLPFDEVVVWDNSARPRDLAVYGRYAALAETNAPTVFVQDDDVVLPTESIAALVAAHQPGRITANMPARFLPHYPDSCLVGFGAVFDRWLPGAAFSRFRSGGWDDPATFNRCCDVVFTTLTPRVLLDLPYEELPYAHDPNRMWKQQGHVGERQQTLAAARAVRDGALS